jgi:plastocyanin
MRNKPQSRKVVLVPFLATCALALASCGGGGSSDETQAEEPSATSESTTTEPAESGAGGEHLERSVKVDIADFAYDPDPVRVQAGGKVIWLNEDSAAHTATADDGSFETGEIDEGKLKSESFKQPGTFTYHCRIHPQMKGTIEVVEG